MPNVKILVLSHLWRELGVTHRGHLWIDGKRIVNFLLVVTELFFASCHCEALLSEIYRNRTNRPARGPRPPVCKHYRRDTPT